MLVYLAALVAIVYFGFGGFANFMDALNFIGPSLLMGIVIGVLISLPFLLIQKLILKKVTLQISKDNIIVQKQGETDVNIALTAIHTIKLNIGKPNTLAFYGANNDLLLHIFTIQTRKNWQQDLSDSLGAFLHLNKQVQSKKSLFKNYESILYTKS